MRAALRAALPLLLLAAVGLTVFALISRRAVPPEMTSRTFFAMDTVMTIQNIRTSEDVLDACVAEIETLEKRLSVTDESSEIALLNRNGQAQLSEETQALLAFALDMGQRTGGALDITLYPVIRAWGFTTGDYRVPKAAELKSLLEKVDYRQVILTDDLAQLPLGMMVDLGSIAKGYAADVTAERLRQAGADSAMINLGGNLYCLGCKADGSRWKIGLQSPLGSGSFGLLEVEDCAVVTSGSYERYFEDEAGNRYGHIFDPATGQPVSGSLLSVTVVGTCALLCDALSTALFVMGTDRALAYLAQQQEVEAILLCADQQIHVTAGLADNFQTLGEFTTWEIIKN